MALVPTTLTAPSMGLRAALPGAGFSFGVDGGDVSGVSEIIPGSIEESALSADTLNFANFQLTSANILGMNATPVVLLPAPGAGKSIVVDYIMFRMIATATAYASGGVVTIGYVGGAAVCNTFAASIINTAGPATVDTILVVGTTNITCTQNAGIQITNATGAFTTGTGTANVFIWYTTV